MSFVYNCISSFKNPHEQVCPRSPSQIGRLSYGPSRGNGNKGGWHDDVIKWKHFPRYWPFVRGIHRSPVNSPQKGCWRGALMFSLICAWTNRRANNRNAGSLKRHRAHYDVIVMIIVRYTVWLTNHNKAHTVWPVKGHCPLQRRYILMAYCKTTVSLWLTHCRYYSFEPGHRFVDRLVVCARMPAVL